MVLTVREAVVAEEAVGTKAYIVASEEAIREGHGGCAGRIWNCAATDTYGGTHGVFN
jgi:hypothetical protein